MSDRWRESAPQVEGALRRAGAPSVRAWLAERPNLDLVALGDQLGVLQILLLRYARDRAESEGWYEEFARDSLARAIHTAMPQGWGNARAPFAWDFTRANAIGGWATDIDRTVGPELKSAVALLDEQAPKGWKPTGPDDPLVVEVVRRLLG